MHTPETCERLRCADDPNPSPFHRVAPVGFCACEHRALSHRYQTTTRTNGGECLSPQCPCVEFAESS